nr:putative disease resistance RPP13-like protein 1 [Coffea arabica]
MAAALVGGSFLSAFLQVLFDRMATPEFVNLFRNQKANDDLLKKLKSELRTVGAVLDDAENKEIRNQYVKEWLEELHDTFYQAEDLVDRISTEALRIKVETEYQSSTSTCTYSGDEFLSRIKPEIETIVARLEGYNKQIIPLGLQVLHSRIKSHHKFETSLVDETTFIGRDADKEKIIQMLCFEDADRDNITVIPIVGLAGLGKTTLARMVYEDSKVELSFPTRAWVCVSEEYDATRITKEILREFRISFGESDNLLSLQVKLRGGLTEKKFLLVLDDVWNSNYNQWDNLRSPFKGGSRGSKIIVTTRNQQVARMMAKERSIHHLDSMLEEDCRSLFKKHAFENRDGNENAELEEIGNKIVTKCRGLPLAVKTVAGILRSKTTPEEWKEILVSEEWTQMDIPDGPLPALRLSYIHLPSHLKRCFAYCAVFPRDYQIRKEEIIQLWQANDLLGYPGENKRIKNEGEKCFHELRMRSLFHQSIDHTFSMHDLVNDLACFIFGKYCLRLEDHQEGNATISGARHFSYHRSWYDTFHKFNLLSQTKNIRTFLPLRTAPMIRLSNKFLEDALPQFMSLRFLSLSYYENIVKLPNSYSGFKQLRFLNLSSTKIKELPEWICSFYNLQTLLLSYCRELEELPENLGKLINLCCLDISGTPLKKMPPQIGRLINLQVLTAFVIGKDSGSVIEELGKLPMLRGKLILSGLENVCSGRDASMANLKGKKHLDELTLEWNGAINDSQAVRDVLDNLQPHSSIKHLKIIGYGGTTFPDWLGNSSLSSLESLSLSRCKYCHSLPSLGQLLSLQSLEIVGMSCISDLTQDFYGDVSATKPFPFLKQLTIEELPEWERWKIPECEVFNRLEELSIIDCPKLIGELPRQLASLQSIEISGCGNLVRPNGQLSILNGENQQNFSSLRRLKISELENLKELPLQLNQLSRLEELNISALKNLEELPLQLNQLSRLEVLTVDDCGSLSPSHVSRPPASLKSLRYKGRCNLELESSSGEGGGALENLTLLNCDSVNVKVEWLASFPMLKFVAIYKCKSVEMLSVPAALALGIGKQSGMTTTTTTTTSTSSVMTSLQSLSFSGCDDLILSFPAPSLASLHICDCKKLTPLPQRMESLLPSLQSLRLSNCPEIECFPEGSLPSTLQSLYIYDCKKLMSRRREWGLEKLPSLMNLNIWGPCDEVESFPEEDWLLPCTLQYLYLDSFQNLKRRSN